MNHITLVSVCYSRADGLREAMPSWLDQKGVDLDIVLVVGPDIERVEHPKVTYIDFLGKFNGCCVGWNEGYKAAKGPLIYTGYSDMVLQDKRYLARFLAHYKDNRIISRQLDRHDGTIDEGIYCYGFLTSKELLERSGGWDVRYDGGYAWEDIDCMHSLVNAGGELVLLEKLPPKLALRHVDHLTIRQAEDFTAKYVRNKNIYNSKFPRKTLVGMYRDNAFEVIRD